MTNVRNATVCGILLMLAVCLCISCGAPDTGGQSREFSFIAISDIHVPTYGFPINQPLDRETLMTMHNQKRLASFVKETLASDPKPSFIMNCGDTGDLGWTRLLHYYAGEMTPLVEAGIPVYTVVGNHDLDYAGIAADDLAEIFDPLGPALIGRHGTRYSFEYGGCHFAVINNRPVTGLIRLNPDELAWLANDLRDVDHDTRVLLFMHANMPEDDTCRIAELLQPFKESVIVQGHRHTAGKDRWGRVPVVLVGSLYGGTPEAGSYSVFDVTPDSVVVRTHDYATPSGVLDEPEAVTFLPAGPALTVGINLEAVEPGTSLPLTVTARPASPGTVEYRFTGTDEWQALERDGDSWRTTVTAPVQPGRHFLVVRFTGGDGSIVLAHEVITVKSEAVRVAWMHDIGSAMMGREVIRDGLAVVPSVEGGVYAFRVDTGEEIWHNEVDSGQILGGLTVSGDIVVYAAGPVVYGCELETGQEVWREDLGETVVAAVVTGKGRVFVPAGEGYCMRSMPAPASASGKRPFPCRS